ncbi:hypothetical protein XNC1_1916 [Xenorhabdus nematophila ATCC 19061]|uniref:Uncharacterized protein n=1 Tax=Xenorhabdus nematophila (strain ATCC 19061 / DSM 3370 / CCUG 14189 / LMG 1036 / NCIMB 9965 / AN6) TaxID=406817 RepID=D3VDQ9_XENNA|nr:hypothetical protein XNC1_1916 [Xenorhabdus nematophila ATCC 19061]
MLTITALGKGLPKFQGIEPVYHIVKRIVAGDTIWQIQKLPEPVLFGLTIFFNRIETFTTTDHGTNRDGQNIDAGHTV